MAKNMSGFDYRVSLRLFHPEIDLSEAARSLGITPKISWKNGEIKVTPTGRKLDGKRNSSYWCADLSGENVISSKNIPLSEFIKKICLDLIVHKTIFESIRTTGGSSELFVGYYTEPNSGFVLSADLLYMVASISLDLDFDIYS